MRYRLRAAVSASAAALALRRHGGAQRRRQRRASGTSRADRAEANAPVPTSVGKGEGKLNLIAWEGYAQPQWVKPFEKQHRLPGQRQVRRLLERDGLADGQRRRRPVRPGVGVGRRRPAADLRRRRRPININLIPSWKQFHPFLQSPAFNTIGGKHYGVSYEFGPNVLLYSTKTFKTRADLVVGPLLQEVLGPDHRPGQPDPDRRRGAVPVEDPAEARDHRPLRADPAAVQRGGRRCSSPSTR